MACGNSEKSDEAVLNFSKQNAGNALTAAENINNINKLYGISECIAVCEESRASDKQNFLNFNQILSHVTNQNYVVFIDLISTTADSIPKNTKTIY